MGLSLQLPIFNSFVTRNRIKLAAIELRNVALQAGNVMVQLRQDIDQAHLNMTNAWERYRIISEQVTAYAESFRAAEVRFNAGVGNSIEYLIAKNNLDRAGINQIAARYDYMFRKKILEFYAQ